MAKALLLGKPLHHKRWSVKGSPDKLTIVVDKTAERRTMTGYGGIGKTPVRETKVTYYKLHLGSCPAGALVYALKDYEPQPEDEQLVLEIFATDV